MCAPRGSAVRRQRTRRGGSAGWVGDGLGTRRPLRCPDAVERFIRALHRDVQCYVTHLCADPQAVDDLAQHTFLRALGSLHRFEGRSSARSWLLSIARRSVIDRLRHTATRPRLSDRPDWQLAVEHAQPHGLLGFDDGIALTQLLGLPYAEAAEVRDCPVGTVRSRVARARATLMDLLAEADAEAPAPAALTAA